MKSDKEHVVPGDDEQDQEEVHKVHEQLAQIHTVDNPCGIVEAQDGSKKTRSQNRSLLVKHQLERL